MRRNRGVKYVECPELRNRARAMWEQGLDTADMARALHVPEHEIERHLHVGLERRRAVVSSLGKVG